MLDWLSSPLIEVVIRPAEVKSRAHPDYSDPQLSKCTQRMDLVLMSRGWVPFTTRLRIALSDPAMSAQNVKTLPEHEDRFSAPSE